MGPWRTPRRRAPCPCRSIPSAILGLKWVRVGALGLHFCPRRPQRRRFGSPCWSCSKRIHVEECSDLIFPTRKLYGEARVRVHRKIYVRTWVPVRPDKTLVDPYRAIPWRCRCWRGGSLCDCRCRSRPPRRQQLSGLSSPAYSTPPLRYVRTLQILLAQIATN